MEHALNHKFNWLFTICRFSLYCGRRISRFLICTCGITLSCLFVPGLAWSSFQVSNYWITCYVINFHSNKCLYISLPLRKHMNTDRVQCSAVNLIHVKFGNGYVSVTVPENLKLFSLLREISINKQLIAGRGSRAVWGMNSLRSFGGRDCGFESRLGHGCLMVCICVSLCLCCRVFR
jgi:hypothetical protein